MKRLLSHAPYRAVDNLRLDVRWEFRSPDLAEQEVFYLDSTADSTADWLQTPQFVPEQHAILVIATIPHGIDLTTWNSICGPHCQNLLATIAWVCSGSREKGISEPILVSPGAPLVCTHLVLAGTIRGELRVRVRLLSAGESGLHYARERGLLVATVADTQRLVIDGSGGSIPIVQEAFDGASAGLLWRSEFHQLDPEAEVSLDSLALRVNLSHQDHARLWDGGTQPAALFWEVLSAWFADLLSQYSNSNPGGVLSDAHRAAVLPSESDAPLNVATLIERVMTLAGLSSVEIESDPRLVREKLRAGFNGSRTHMKTRAGVAK